MIPIFCTKNFCDLSGSSVTGGDWRAALPLANLADRRVKKVARSVTDAAADSQFYWDLGASRLVRVASLHGLNLSLAGRIRVRGFSGVPPTGQLYDSGTLNPFEIYPSGVLEAGHPAFGTTTLAQEDYDLGYPVDFIHVLTTATDARYWLFEITDTSNPAGYIDVGRSWLSYGFRPTHGISVGARFTYETDTRKSRSRGGAAIIDARPQLRRFEFDLRSFSEDEALVYLQEVGRFAGLDRQMLFVADEDDGVHMHRRAFLATLQTIGALSYSQTVWSDHRYSLIEEL